MATVVPLRPGITGESFAVQPHSIEAEQAIIGSALVNNAVIDRCPWLAAEAFFEPVHGRIWDVLLSARRAGRRADPVLVKRLFEDDRELAEMDGAAYLARLAHAADTITTAVDYARHVDGLADASAQSPVVHAAGAAQFFDRERGVAGVEQEGIDGGRELLRAGQVGFVEHMDHLHEADARQALAEDGVGGVCLVVTKLDRAGAATPMLGDDGLGIGERGE